jgi:hypothetical protein
MHLIVFANAVRAAIKSGLGRNYREASESLKSYSLVWVRCNVVTVDSLPEEVQRHIT